MVTLNVTINDEEPTTQVRYAYFIVGAALLLHWHCFIFFLLYLNGDKTCCIQKKDGNNEQPYDEDSLANFNKLFLISFVTLVFLFYWIYCVLELTYAAYLTTFTVDELNWTKISAATLTSVFWAAFTVGRGAGIFIVKYFKPETLLISMSILTIITLFPEVFFADAHISVMWICTIAFGLPLC